jgi:hypothetical protein
VLRSHGLAVQDLWIRPAEPASPTQRPRLRTFRRERRPGTNTGRRGLWPSCCPKVPTAAGRADEGWPPPDSWVPRRLRASGPSAPSGAAPPTPARGLQACGWEIGSPLAIHHFTLVQSLDRTHSSERVKAGR